jgi:hypothetical protein
MKKVVLMNIRENIKKDFLDHKLRKLKFIWKNGKIKFIHVFLYININK